MFDFPPPTPWIYAWLGAAALVGIIIGWLLGRIGASRYKSERNGLRSELDEAMEVRRLSEDALSESGALAADLQHQLDETKTSLSDADRDIERLRAEVENADTRVTQLEREALSAGHGDSEEIDQLTARLSASHQEIDSLRASLSAATVDTDSRVAAAESETQEALSRAAVIEEALSAARLEAKALHSQLQDGAGRAGDDNAYVDDLKSQLAVATASAESSLAALAAAEARLDETAALLEAARAELDAVRADADTRGDFEGELAARDHLLGELKQRVAELSGIEDRLKARDAELGELRRTQAAVLAAKEAEARGLRERLESLDRMKPAEAPVADDQMAAALQTALDDLAAAEERATHREQEAAALREGIAHQSQPAAPAAAPISRPEPLSASVEERLDRMQEVLSDKEARIAYLADRVARLESSFGAAPRQAPTAAPASIAVPSPLAPEPPVAPEPDDLTQIWGIGPAIQKKLNSVGITTFEQVAVLGPDDQAHLGDLLGDFLDRFEADDWVGQARRFIVERGGTIPMPPLQPIRLTPPPAPVTHDDLTAIKGIGPYIQTTLNGLGVTSFAQIAAWSERDVEEFGTALVIFQDRIAREGWVEQAGRLMRRR
ncbi:MAG: hypothetical protein MUP76_03435 [Acidimicrobiia bacterium]|nr:hypothetical protein [Acidimicrobiia bacterium]